MHVYTLASNPFRFGATHDLVKADIDEYERVHIGKGYYAIVFYNPVRSIYHIALEDGGALIGTDMDKVILINRIKREVAEGDEEVMVQQVQMAKEQLAKAELIERDRWFQKFKKR